MRADSRQDGRALALSSGWTLVVTTAGARLYMPTSAAANAPMCHVRFLVVADGGGFSEPHHLVQLDGEDRDVVDLSTDQLDWMVRRSGEVTIDVCSQAVASFSNEDRRNAWSTGVQIGVLSAVEPPDGSPPPRIDQGAVRSTGGPVYVRGYYRANGTYVRPYTRRR